jgi:hypothetical protein
MLAASGRGDIRDIAGPVVRQSRNKGVFGRLIDAMKGGY